SIIAPGAGFFESRKPSGTVRQALLLALLPALNLVAGGDPRVQAAVQGAHFGVAEPDQFFCDLRRRGFVGTSAVENDLAISRQLLEPPVHFGDVHRQRARSEEHTSELQSRSDLV